MEFKVYVPQTVEIPDEYLLALVRRVLAADGSASGLAASRGQLVRQAVRDGLLRSLDAQRDDDGTVDVVCDPSGEQPLEIEGRSMTWGDLQQALSESTAEGHAGDGDRSVAA